MTNNKQTNLTTNNIKYTGKVTVNITKKGKTIYSNTYKNNGNAPLFEFLTRCIGYGNINTNLSPNFIRLFGRTDSSPEEGYKPTETPIPLYIWTDSGQNRAVTGYSLYTQKSIEKIEGDNQPDDEFYPFSKDSYIAHINFMLPGNLINISKIYQVALYNEDNTGYDKLGNYSAVFSFYTVAANGAITWSPISFNKGSADYNFYIDWTMEFTNN